MKSRRYSPSIRLRKDNKKGPNRKLTVDRLYTKRWSMTVNKDQRLDLITRQLLKLATEYRGEGATEQRLAILDIVEAVGEFRDRFPLVEEAQPQAHLVPVASPVTVAPPPVLNEPTPVAQKPTDSQSEYYGLGIGEAARRVIDSGGAAMHVSQIWEKLSAAGVRSAHNDPHHAVYDGLKKRAKRDRDVIRLPNGLWDVTSRYTREKLVELRGASRSVRTLAGIEVAKARGVRFGQPTKLTDPIKTEIERRIASGERIPAIAKSLKLAEATIRKYYKREELTKLRELGAASLDPNGSGFN